MKLKSLTYLFTIAFLCGSLGVYAQCPNSGDAGNGSGDAIDATLTFDMDDCNSNTISGTNVDYSEFTATLDTDDPCVQVEVEGGNLYRLNPTENPHSCTPGIEDSAGMCVGIDRSCVYNPGSDQAVRFDILVNPVAGPSTLSGISFYELAPFVFQYIGGANGPNAYPTRYAVRVLANGQDVFNEFDIPTTNEWSLETFDFSDNPAFTVTEETLFNFELTAYCSFDNGADIAVWDLDQISVMTSHCQNGFEGDGGGTAGVSFELGQEECTGTTYDFINTSDNTDDLTWYFDWPNLTPSSNEVNPSFTFDAEGTYIVRLESNEGGCSSFYELEVSAYNNGLSGGIDVFAESCDGDLVNVIIASTVLDNNGDPVDNLDWTISVNGGADQTFDGDAVNLELDINDVLDISLDAVGASGCTATYNINDLTVEDIFPLPVVDATIIECLDDGFVIGLSDGTNHNPYQVNGYNWTIAYDGNVASFTTETVQITSIGDLIDVGFSTDYSNGCSSQNLTQEISISEYLIPNLDILVSGLSNGTSGGCIPDSDQELELNISGGSVAGTLESVNWSVDIAGAVTTYTGNPVDIGDLITEMAVVTATANYSNGCSFSVSETFEVGGGTMNGDVNFTVDECNADGYTVTLSPPSTNFPISTVEWNIVIDGETTTSNELNPTINIPLNGSAEVSGSVSGTTGCSLTFGPTIIGENGIPGGDDNNNITPEYNISVVTPGPGDPGNPGDECMVQPGQYLELQQIDDNINGEITNVDWTVSIDGETYAFNGNPVEIGDLEGTAQVSATVSYSNGCVFDYTQSVILDGGTPDDGIGFVVTDCGDDAFTVLLSPPSTPNDFTVESIAWTFDDNGNITSSDQTNPTIMVANDGSVTVSGVITFTNSCTQEFGPTILGEGGVPGGNDNNNLTPDFEIVIISGGMPGDGSDNGDPDCVLLPEGQVIQVNETNSFIDGDITNVEWLITLDGNTFPFTGNPIDIGGLIGTASITIVVTYSNGCVFEYTQPLDLPGGNGVDFEAELAECNDDGSVDVLLSPPAGIPDEFEIESILWTIQIDGETTTSESQNPIITIPANGSAFVFAVISFTNGCTVTTNSQTLNADDFLPTMTIQSTLAEGVDCGDNPLTYEFTAISDGNPATNVSWTYVQDGEVVNAEGNPIQIDLEVGETIDISATGTVAVGCIVTATDSFTASGGTVEILPEFNGEPVIDCEGDDTPLILNGNPNFNYTWDPTDGLSFTDNVNFSDPIVSVSSPTVYNVTIVDGDCVGTDSVLVIPEADAIPQVSYGGDGSGTFCDGIIILDVTNAIDGVDYVWSTDSNFENIIGTGTTLEWDGAESGESTIYVQIAGAEDAACDVSTAVPVVNGEIELEYDDPLELCPGDTLAYPITNLNDDQELTFEWEDHPNLISVDENGVPTIGAGAEDFSIGFTATNQYGCTTDGEVLNVSTTTATNGDLSFTFDLIECGEYGVIFNPSGFGPDSLLMWDFGDPTSDDDVSDEINPMWTYASSDTFTVTLTDLSSICPGIPNPLIMDIIVPDLPVIEIIGTDTDTIESENPFVIVAETNSPSGEISWCDEEGMIIGTGDTLVTDFDMDQDVFAKVIDQFGCVDTTMVHVIPIFLPPNPFDTIGIAGSPEPFGPCAFEQFEVMVINVPIDADFSYDWAPDECIISGDNERVATVSVTADPKDFSVLVTDNVSGEDTTLFYSVDPITIDISIINTGNNPVIIGEPADLGIDGLMVGDNVEWSTGEVSDSITVMPTESTTYVVTVTDENGCSGTDELVIDVTVPPCAIDEGIYIPNAFSPNGDNVNDVFIVRSNIIDPANFEFFVYDRWGEEVFISTDLDSGWDGSFDGENLSPDVYAYCIKATCTDGETITHSGNVSLIK